MFQKNTRNLSLENGTNKYKSTLIKQTTFHMPYKHCIERPKTYISIIIIIINPLSKYSNFDIS